ncbi:MAG: hypothetical protein V1907_02185 [Candidatus Kerfeldbacteria bacterium]
MLLRLIEGIEKVAEPLLPRTQFYRRALWCAAFGTLLYVVVFTVGIVGFVACEGCRALDAAVNSTMLMSQLGHVTEFKKDATKWFLIFYGPLASLGFFTSFSLLVIPWGHRILHHIHTDPPSGRR